MASSSTEPTTTTPFIPTRILHIAPHGNMQNHSAAIHDMSAFLADHDWTTIPDFIPQAEELIRTTAATTSDAPPPNPSNPFTTTKPEPRAIHIYTIQRSGPCNQTFSLFPPPPTTTTEPLATFHVPITYHAHIPITFSSLPSIPSPQPVRLGPSGVLTRGQEFTYNSAVHTWEWTSAASILLKKQTAGGEAVVAMARMTPKFYRSGGLVIMGEGDASTPDEREEWTRIVVATVLGVWRREREVRYGFPGWKRKEKRNY